MLKYIISSLLFIISISLYSKENPRIDKKELSSLRKTINKGDTYYRKGLYDAALQQYMRVYAVKDDHSPLNYKIAVSHLYGVNPKSALEFFNRTDPAVASDYYSLRGIALVYHKQYEEAKASFRQYTESLPPKQATRMQGKINRFIAICDFSAKAVQDSLPVFMINAGPQVNSYYDDYSAVELLSPSPSLYFTTRRPKSNDVNLESHTVFSERIMFSPEFVNGVASEANDSHIKSGRHTSVAGVDNNTGTLLYYKGKKRFGDIFSSQIKDNGKSKNKRLPGAISKKTTAEGSISFADNGDAYFISNRWGGQGGKDIWHAQKKGKNSFHSPVNLSALNTPLDEECVFVTPDGNTLYFSSNGLPGFGGYDIYKSEKLPNGTWGNPVNMGYPVNSPDDDLFYRTTSDPNLALLSSKRSGGFGGLDIYYIRNDLRIPFELSGNVTDIKTGRTLDATVRLYDRTTNMPVASIGNDTILQRYVLNMEDVGDFYLQADAAGYRSVIADFKNPTTRHSKLYQSFELEKLLHPYTLNGYVSDVRTGRPVQAEVILKMQNNDQTLYRTVSDAVTGFYSLTIEDKENFELSLRAPEYFDHNEPLQLKAVADESGTKNITMQRSIMIYIVTGIVTAEDHTTPLTANITLSRVDDDSFTQRATSEKEEYGKYEITVTDVGPFLMEVTSEGYFFANSVLEFTLDSTLVIRNFALQKMEAGVKIVIENILFTTGAASLRPESFVELNKLVNLLKENPSVRIEVSGHTDNVGSATSNRTLSRNRALTVRNYLISQGIAGERVEYNGYGFDRPIAPNTSEEGRAANRRVEIEILE